MVSDQLGYHFDWPVIEAGHAGVEFFFVLSGFIMAYVHGRDIGHRDRQRHYWFSRISRIYPLYWIILALTALGQALVGQVEPNLQSLASILRAVFLLPFADYPPVAVAWTLSHEMLFYILLGLAIAVGRPALWLLGLWWGLCLWVLCLKLGGHDPSFPLAFVGAPINLLFGLGILAYWALGVLTPRRALVAVGLGAVIFGFGIANDANPALEDVRFFIYGAGAMLLISGAVILERAGWIRVPGWLIFMGNASYATYLGHSLVMMTVVTGLRVSGYAGQVPGLVIVCGIVVAGTLGGAALHVICERPLMRVLRRFR